MAFSRFAPAAVGGSQRTHGPIAGEHDAVGGRNALSEWLMTGARCLRSIFGALANDAGDLAHHVLVASQAIPCRAAIASVGAGAVGAVAAVVPGLSAFRHISTRRTPSPVGGTHAQVEAESHFFEDADAADELGRVQKAAGGPPDVQDLRTAFGGKVALERFEVLAKPSSAGRPEITAAARAYRRAGRCRARNRLVLLLLHFDIGLHVDAFDDVEPLRGGLVVFMT